MIKKFSTTHYQLIILIMTAVCLFLIPNLFWGSLYIVGGDDSRLYYIFPKEFLTFAFKMTSDNAFGFLGGYYPKSSYASLFFIIYLLKHIPFFNVQFLMYGLNLAFGFIFFYLFLGLWVKDKTAKNFFAKVVASLFYIFSTYLINTFYTNQITSIYIVSAMPATLYFFFKSVLDKRVVYAVIAAIYISIFSVKLESVPWSFASLICLIPLFITDFFEYKKRFLIHGAIFALSFILLNLFWISHLFYPVFTQEGQGSNVTYYSASNDNAVNYMIKAGTGIFGTINAVFNERDPSIGSHGILQVLIKSIFLLIIIFGGMLLQKTSKPQRKYYLVSLACLLLAIYFFQPKMGGWGDDIFIFFNAHVPLFSMFRNMYDKFSFALAFTYAYAFYFGLTIILGKIRNKLILVLLIIAPVIITFMNAYQFIFPKYNDTAFSIRVSGAFNDDFTNLVQYIKNTHTSSRYLWVPFNYPSYVYVEDKYNKNHFYFGLSPLTMLADTSDYAGYLSFGSIENPFLGTTILDLLGEKKYDQVGKIYQEINVKYIIDDKQQVPDEAKAFLYSTPNMLESQNSAYKKALFGPKIKDFGNRYSIYKINPKFDNNKIYLKNNENTGIKFTRISDMEYNVSIAHLNKPETLVLQDYFNRNWIVYLESQDKRIVYKNKSSISANGGYANVWNISADEIKKNFNKEFYSVNKDGSININLKLYFDQLSIINTVNSISLITFIILLIYIVAYIVKQKL